MEYVTVIRTEEIMGSAGERNVKEREKVIVRKVLLASQSLWTMLQSFILQTRKLDRLLEK